MRIGNVNRAEIEALAKDPRVLAEIGETTAEPLAEAIAARAPKDTGEAAATIHSEPDPDEPGFKVGWSPDAFYLRFHELGTEHQPARPFARPTADEFNDR